SYKVSFFFSSRRRHTRSKRDWSSDVCSSDLRAVATIMINTLDKTYPWGNVDTQMAYMNSSDKWEEVPMSDRQEGDILASNTGGNSHIVYLIGEGEAGENTIAQASYLGQVANIQDGSYAVNDPHYKAYRFVGTPDSTGSSLID